MYRHLDIEKIISTQERLRNRIEERFPTSGLSKVATELLAVGEQTRGRLDRVRKPNWRLRLLTVAGIMLLLLGVAWGVWITFRAETRVAGLADRLQGIDAAVNELILVGAAVYFLVSFERKIKRRVSLRGLHELRSLAHVIDAHQLTKDPEQFVARGRLKTDSSPERHMTLFELTRYLDYCSELLSVTGKLAALYAQCDEDPIVLASVNDVESLASDFSHKIWQKMTILDSISLRKRELTPPR